MPTGVFERSEKQKRLFAEVGNLGGLAMAKKYKNCPEQNPHYRHGKRTNGKDWPEAHKCRAKLQLAILTGKIKKLSCQICGNIDVVGHHKDYSRPYDVIWFCRKHHYKIHLDTHLLNVR